MSAFFALLLSSIAVFMILLVLVQRGRGGGLAGALGGMGGSSAFGAKAGDIFTRITVVTAAIWIAISIVAYFWADHRTDPFSKARTNTSADDSLDAMPQAPRTNQTGPPATGAAPAATSPPDAETAVPPASTDTGPPASTDAAPPATN